MTNSHPLLRRPRTRTAGRLVTVLAAVPLSAALLTGSALAGTHGKPADGSVGRADNKAPAGQSTDDQNSGYECDTNRGVGQGNPAHSACATTAPGGGTGGPADGGLDPIGGGGTGPVAN